MRAFAVGVVLACLIMMEAAMHDNAEVAQAVQAEEENQAYAQKETIAPQKHRELHAQEKHGKRKIAALEARLKMHCATHGICEGEEGKKRTWRSV